MDLKEKALEISNQYPFSKFPVAASAVRDKEGEEKFSSLDEKFMKFLEQGAHLDVKRYNI